MSADGSAYLSVTKAMTGRPVPINNAGIVDKLEQPFAMRKYGD
jgi:hypothetical protein